MKDVVNNNDEFLTTKEYFYEHLSAKILLFSGLSVTDVSALSLVFYWVNNRVKTHTHEIQPNYYFPKIKNFA